MVRLKYIKVAVVASMQYLNKYSVGWIGRPCTPPRTVWDLFYFVPGTSPIMKNGCHHHQIGMDYLYDVIFKMADSEFGKITIFC